MLKNHEHQRIKAMTDFKPGRFSGLKILVLRPRNFDDSRTTVALPMRMSFFVIPSVNRDCHPKVFEHINMLG